MPVIATTTLRVNETFASLQGEGVLIGAPSFFIRLDGCPLRCSWCDTPYALAGTAGAPAVVEDLCRAAAPYRNVVITGGEPLAQDVRELVDGLSPRHHVTVETSGAIFADLPGVALFSISPKVGTSGYRPQMTTLRRFCLTAHGRMQLKFVIADDGDLDLALDCLDGLSADLPRDTPVVLQPESGAAGRGDAYAACLRRLAERVEVSDAWRRYAARVLPQLHYLLWSGAPGR